MSLTVMASSPALHTKSSHLPTNGYNSTITTLDNGLTGRGVASGGDKNSGCSYCSDGNPVVLAKGPCCQGQGHGQAPCCHGQGHGQCCQDLGQDQSEGHTEHIHLDPERVNMTQLRLEAFQIIDCQLVTGVKWSSKQGGKENGSINYVR